MPDGQSLHNQPPNRPRSIIRRFSSLFILIAIVVVIAATIIFLRYSFKEKQDNTIGGKPTGIVAAESGLLYIIDHGFGRACGFDCFETINPTIWVFDPTTNKTVESIAIPYNFYQNCNNGGLLLIDKILFGCKDSTSLFRIDYKTFSKNVIRFTADEKLLVDEENELLHSPTRVFDLKTLKQTASIHPSYQGKQFSQLNDFAIGNKNLKYLVGYNGDEGVVEIVDLKEKEIKDTIKVGEYLRHIVVDTQTNTAFFTNYKAVNNHKGDAKTLVKYNLTTKEVEETLRFGPEGINNEFILAQDEENLYLTTGGEMIDEGGLLIVKKSNLSEYKLVDIGVNRFNVSSNLFSMKIIDGKVYLAGKSKNKEPLLLIFNSKGEFLYKTNLRD